jgi:two-component system chemotaxis sensor kinase CheA
LALDMEKYRRLFLEEAADHLAEISRALLELEKDVASVESIDSIFRMAHSIKSMAASLGYDSIAEVAHTLEDRMEVTRSAGSLAGSEELNVLFQGLEALEQMVEVVRDEGASPPVRPGLLELLARPAEADAHSSPESAADPLTEAKKKILS